MTRINTNINSLVAQRVLQQQNTALQTSLERLSTGLRINSGRDDPAGLIASEGLKSQQTALQAALGNVQRAGQITNVAEGGLQQINASLLQLQSLVTSTANDAGLSDDEKQANQQQIDAILQSINRISSTTSFQGVKLLNGGMDFTVSAQSTSVTNLEVQGAKLGNTNLKVQANITQSAQHGALFLSLGATTLDLSTTNPSLIFDVAGAEGSRQFTFSSGTALSNMATQINAFTQTTGVSAVVSGTGLNFRSTDFGSKNFVSIDIVNTGDQTGYIMQMSAGTENTAVTSGDVALSAANGPVLDTGQDVAATINGIQAVADGKHIMVDTDALQASMDLTTTGAQTLGSLNMFTITGGGAKFSLGPTVDQNSIVQIGISNVSTTSLGLTTVDNLNTVTKTRFPTIQASLDDLGSGKALNVVDGDLTSAQEVVNNAIDQVSSLRGRLGSFQKNVLDATTNSLNVAYENTSAAQSQIADTDFAAATANLTRNQILVQAASQALKIANTQPQNVLQLLS